MFFVREIYFTIRGKYICFYANFINKIMIIYITNKILKNK